MAKKSGPEPPFIHTTQAEWPSLRLAFWDLLHLVSKTITLTKTSASSDIAFLAGKSCC